MPLSCIEPYTSEATNPETLNFKPLYRTLIGSLVENPQLSTPETDSPLSPDPKPLNPTPKVLKPLAPKPPNTAAPRHRLKVSALKTSAG